jgi:hypothetical protein
VLLDVLFIHSEHVRWRGRIDLHVIVECEAADIAEIASFAHPQDHGFDKPIEPREQMMWPNFLNVPGADRALHRLHGGVLADALQATKDQGVVDFLGRPLNAVGEPRDDVIEIAWIDAIYMVEPARCFRGVTGHESRRAIEIERRHTAALDPSSF